MSAEIIADTRRFTLAIKAKGAEAREFGNYLSEHLDRLYEAFQQDSAHSRKEP